MSVQSGTLLSRRSVWSELVGCEWYELMVCSFRVVIRLFCCASRCGGEELIRQANTSRVALDEQAPILHTCVRGRSTHCRRGVIVIHGCAAGTPTCVPSAIYCARGVV